MMVTSKKSRKTRRSKRRIFKWIICRLTFTRVIAILSLGVALPSLYFAYVQAEKLGASIDASTWTNLAEQMLEVDKLFIEHPNMRKYFYRAQDINDNDPEYDLAVSIAGFQLDFIDNFFAFQPHLEPKNYDPESWNNYFVFTFKKSPLMCRILHRDANMYDDDINGIAREACGWDAATRSK